MSHRSDADNTPFIHHHEDTMTLTNLELEQFNTPSVACVRLTSPHSGRSYVLPCEIVDEDRVAGSSGTHGLDRLRIVVADEECWVERRDLCDEGGELIDWQPHPRRGPTGRMRQTAMVGR